MAQRLTPLAVKRLGPDTQNADLGTAEGLSGGPGDKGLWKRAWCTRPLPPLPWLPPLLPSSGGQGQVKQGYDQRSLELEGLQYHCRYCNLIKTEY